jgi:hypothetical protein
MSMCSKRVEIAAAFNTFRGSRFKHFSYEFQSRMYPTCATISITLLDSPLTGDAMATNIILTSYLCIGMYTWSEYLISRKRGTEAVPHVFALFVTERQELENRVSLTYLWYSMSLPAEMKEAMYKLVSAASRLQVEDSDAKKMRAGLLGQVSVGVDCVVGEGNEGDGLTKSWSPIGRHVRRSTKSPWSSSLAFALLLWLSTIAGAVSVVLR